MKTFLRPLIISAVTLHFPAAIRLAAGQAQSGPTKSSGEAALYRNYFRGLETPEEYFDYRGAPNQGRGNVYEMEWPEPILDKVYPLNRERIFKQFKGVNSKGGGQ